MNTLVEDEKRDRATKIAGYSHPKKTKSRPDPRRKKGYARYKPSQSTDMVIPLDIEGENPYKSSRSTDSSPYSSSSTIVKKVSEKTCFVCQKDYETLENDTYTCPEGHQWHLYEGRIISGEKPVEKGVTNEDTQNVEPERDIIEG